MTIVLWMSSLIFCWYANVSSHNLDLLFAQQLIFIEALNIGHRQFKPKGGAKAERAFNVDVYLVQLKNFFYNGQPKPHAFF